MGLEDLSFKEFNELDKSSNCYDDYINILNNSIQYAYECGFYYLVEYLEKRKAEFIKKNDDISWFLSENDDDFSKHL